LYYQRAAIYFDNDQPANALNDLNKALKLNPKLWQAYELRADVESYLNMTTQALADANKAVKAAPNDALAWVKLATVENRMYQYQKALAHAKHALELNDKEGLACGEMSASLAGMNRYKESLQWINKHAAIEAPNVHERVLSGRAMEEFHAGDYSDSVKDATAAVDRNSIDRGLDMLVRALGEQGLGMSSQAEQDVEQGLALEKNPARGHRIAGDYYRLIGDDAQAIEEYNKSISLFPQGTNSYRNRGITYYRQGSLHNGLEDLTAACRSRPSCITLSYKALIEQDLGMQEDADRDIAEAAVVSEPLSLFYSNRGAIEFKRRDLVKALADATKAQTMDNLNADAYQLLGLIYQAQGNSQQAELNFTRAKHLGYPGSSPPAGW
jgi:tetratricopeptide (TPR) repeat protein